MFGNWFKTSLLMAAVVALFGVVGAALGGAQDMLVALVVNVKCEFPSCGSQHWLACEGMGVRVTDADGHHGVGAELLTPFFSQDEEKVVARPAKR